MGTWGSGIYENDSTRDYIDGIINNLCNSIEDMLRHDYTLLHAGMTQSYLFMCHIDLLEAICSRDDLHTSLPDTYEIKRCKAKYMEVCEFTIDACEPTLYYKSERAEVLKKSFDRLIALSRRNK